MGRGKTISSRTKIKSFNLLFNSVCPHPMSGEEEFLHAAYYSAFFARSVAVPLERTGSTDVFEDSSSFLLLE